MKTLERRIEETLQLEAARLPDIEQARLIELRHPPKSRWLRPAAVIPAVIVGVLVLAAPLLWLTRGLDVAEPSTPLNQPQDPATTVVDFEVAELDSSAADPADVSESDPEGMVLTVEDTLASTGKTYNEPPDEIPAAAITDSRAVIVGGNGTRSAGIWYSDGGAWIPGEIEYPASVAIGESDGDYRLADGISHLDVFGNTLVAWEAVQRVFEGGEPDFVGTFLAVSADGANWNASVIDHQLATLTPWNDGAVATAWFNDPTQPAVALWTTDFVTWTQVADLGEGFPVTAEIDEEGIIVTLRVIEVTTLEDGSFALGPGETVRRVRLSN